MSGNNVLFFGLGLVAGAVGSFFATKHYYKKYYADLANENISRMVVAKSEEPNDIPSEPEPIVEEVKESAVDEAEKVITSQGYRSMDIDVFESEEPDKEEEMKDVFGERQVAEISVDELDDENNNYDVVRYSWYENEDRLVNDETDESFNTKDEMMDEIGGIDFRGSFADPSKQTVYIRDYTLECDYIIERVQG